VAGRRGSATGWAWSRRFVYVYCGSIVLANLVMLYALLARDFSVSYVAQVGSRQVPDWVAVVSLWSSLEGSILFLGPRHGVVHLRRHLDESRQASRVHALRRVRLAVLRRVLQLPDFGSGAALQHGRGAGRSTGPARIRCYRTTC
jgi:hypothetical protein